MANVKVIALKEHESIVAVVPGYCHGPGWSNALTVVHIVNSVTSQHRCEYIQPDERTPEMHTLFRAGEAMQSALIGATPTKKAWRRGVFRILPGAKSKQEVPGHG